MKKFIKFNMLGTIEYKRSYGKYGLLKDGSIVKIRLWSTDIDPQEIHFTWKRKSQWAYMTDFVAFSNSKVLIRLAKRLYKNTK